ncbi:hypothetical protein Zm00014a_002844 [Zea mays]|jgi:hypothetical protein|uniref:Uncharacterized protein n=1 Tax=Zea mays TaxID=4577 RepID=A0A3L6F6N7_MAIZE|nr:hypothetical protein Zm00014a_002844 [Zea mays]
MVATQARREGAGEWFVGVATMTSSLPPTTSMETFPPVSPSLFLLDRVSSHFLVPVFMVDGRCRGWGRGLGARGAPVTGDGGEHRADCRVLGVRDKRRQLICMMDNLLIWIIVSIASEDAIDRSTGYLQNLQRCPQQRSEQ